MFTPAMILLMTVNTIAASGAALVALQTALLAQDLVRHSR